MMTDTQPTVKAAMASHPLAPAVLRQLGGGADAVRSALEAAQHGADAGFHGFTYYSDTISFAKRNRRKIAASVYSMADDLGESADSMVKSFRCLDDPSEQAIDIALATTSDGAGAVADDVEQVRNALAWFALEEVGHAIASLSE